MKRLLIATLVLALVGVCLAVWWWSRSGTAVSWWSRSEPEPAVASSTGFVEDDHLSIASPLTPSPWDADSPLELLVTLLRPMAPATEWAADRPWWNQLALYRVDGESESPMEFEIIEQLEGPAADDEVQFVTLAIAADLLTVGPVTLRPRLRYADGSTLVGADLRGIVERGVRTPRERAIAEARVHLGAGRHDAALAALDGVEFAEMADVQILRADALAGAGRVDEAIALLNEVLARIPGDLSEPPTAIWRRLRELEQERGQ